MTRYLQLMRFDKPIGTLLLFWPVCWALIVAYHARPPILMMTVFSIGVILTRAAGCIVNDLCDRTFDAHVSRTQHRPLANGTVSAKEAYALLAILCLGLVSLLLFLNPINRIIAILAAGLTLFYPLTKRFFAYPQLILGITFNIGVMMVFVQANMVSTQAWLFYLASIAWTFSYDTVYALADLSDDKRIGIRSSALSLGKYVHVAVSAGYALMFVLLGVALAHPIAGVIIALSSIILYFWGGVLSLKTLATHAPMRFFNANALLGAMIAIITLT